MRVKFNITFEDGQSVSSHDENWVQKFDHSHFLPPNKDQKWVVYELESDNGIKIRVNFQNGIFNVNNLIIHPGTPDGGRITMMNQPQRWFAESPWNIYNGSPYFPIVGRRMFKGDNIDATLYFCGYKREVVGKTYEKVIYLYPDGSITLT
jgi:hypothetical protein